MIIYNITTKVDWSVADDWKVYMHANFIPSLLETGCFDNFRFMKLLQVDESDGPTFALQLTSPSLSLYSRYIDAFAPEIRRKLAAQWGQNFVDFHSLMQEVE